MSSRATSGAALATLHPNARGTVAETFDGERIEIDRAGGYPIEVRHDGEPVPDARLALNEGVVRVFADDGHLIGELPLDAESRARWMAESPFARLGIDLVLLRTGRPFVRGVRPDGPAAAAGLREGDVLTHAAGWSAVPAGLRAALLMHLAGGELVLGVERSGDELELRVELPPLLTAEEFAASHDPLGTWVARATQGATLEEP